MEIIAMTAAAEKVIEGAKTALKVCNVSKEMKSVAESEGADQILATRNLASSVVNESIDASSKTENTGAKEFPAKETSILSKPRGGVFVDPFPESFSPKKGDVFEEPTFETTDRKLHKGDVFVEPFPENKGMTLPEALENTSVGRAEDKPPQGDVFVDPFPPDGLKLKEDKHQELIQEEFRTTEGKANMDDSLDETENRLEQDNPKENLSTEVEKVPRVGGSYGDLKYEGWGWNSEPPREIHHMPSNESSPLETWEGPAIVMEYSDHLQTASWGRSHEAQAYRAKQSQLIKEGKYREALQMDIDDIHDKFGDKYDEGIKQMLEYVDELEKQNRI